MPANQHKPNEEDKSPLRSGSRYPCNPPPSDSYSVNYARELQVFDRIIDMYAGRLFIEVGVLTGEPDLNKVQELVEDLFLDLWKRRHIPIPERPGLFLHRATIQHVFTYLMKTANKTRIKYLQTIVTVDSSCYAQIIISEKPWWKTNPFSLISKRKRTCKTCY